MANNKAELTAEWTVHAQLTISRPTELLTTHNQHSESATADGTAEQHTGPVKVVYKWSSDDVKNTDATNSGKSFKKGNVIFTTESSNKSKNDSFHSTGVPLSDSGFSTTTNTSKKPASFHPTCRSTCSITLSAYTDMYPPTVDIQEEPFACNTMNFTLSPDQPTSQSENPADRIKHAQFLSMKDAFSQTSDSEKKLQTDRSLNDGRKRRPYTYSKTTDSILPMSPLGIEKGQHFSPSRRLSRSPFNHSQSDTMSPPVSATNKSNSAKKQPRTVHIDVYCTGSDADDTTTSSSSTNNDILEEESNTTRQTVIDSNQMKLHHMRIADNKELPRRIVKQILDKQRHSSPSKLRQFLLSQTDSKEEISESKQMLFDKHIGDQTKQPKHLFQKNRFHFSKNPSDDCLSSNYPNSSRSTVRDLTCSSLSSALASSTAVNDDLESSWKDTDADSTIPQSNNSIGQSDSFDYDSSVDNMRIKEMEQLWSQSKQWRSPEKERKFLLQQRKMIDYIRQNEKLIEEKHDDADSENSANITESDRSFSFNNKLMPTFDYKSAKVRTYSHKLLLSPADQEPHTNIQKHPEIIFTSSPYYSLPSSIQTTTPGMQSEHWMRASKFGALIDIPRKIDHHFGPAKNPDCQCQHCRRWMAEREQGRKRASSTGDVPYKR